MTFWAGYGSKLVYRWRPEPGNPEGSIMDIIMMSPIPLGEKKPEPARKVVLEKFNLIKRRQNDNKAVQELDISLLKFDSKDPVKYDFALFGLGIDSKFELI